MQNLLNWADRASTVPNRSSNEFSGKNGALPAQTMTIPVTTGIDSERSTISHKSHHRITSDTVYQTSVSLFACQRLNSPECHYRDYRLICLPMQQPSKNYYMFTRWPENRGDVNDVIYDADGACMGRYGCVGGPTRDNMGSREWLVVGLKSRAASARVTKHFVTIFSKTCNKYEFRILNSRFLG